MMSHNLHQNDDSPVDFGILCQFTLFGYPFMVPYSWAAAHLRGGLQLRRALGISCAGSWGHRSFPGPRCVRNLRFGKMIKHMSTYGCFPKWGYPLIAGYSWMVDFHGKIHL